MPAPRVENVETHRDDSFAYGKMYVDGEFVSDWMRSISVTRRPPATDEQKKRASSLAKFMINNYAAIVNKYGLPQNSMPPSYVAQIVEMYENKTISKESANLLIEFYVLHYTLLLKVLEGKPEVIREWHGKYNAFCLENEKFTSSSIIIEGLYDT